MEELKYLKEFLLFVQEHELFDVSVFRKINLGELLSNIKKSACEFPLKEKYNFKAFLSFFKKKVLKNLSENERYIQSKLLYTHNHFSCLINKNLNGKSTRSIDNIVFVVICCVYQAVGEEKEDDILSLLKEI